MLTRETCESARPAPDFLRPGEGQRRRVAKVLLRETRKLEPETLSSTQQVRIRPLPCLPTGLANLLPTCMSRQ